MSAVFKREFHAYMNNVYGFLFMAVLLCACGVMVALMNIIVGSPAIEYALYYGRYVLMLMIPILCMRSMAEDRRNKTDMFYLSLPLSTASVVLGKYFAALIVFAIPCGVLALYPLLFGLFGPVRFLAAYMSLLFFFLIGAALIALCQLLSSLTDNLVVAAVLGVVASAALCFVPALGALLPDTPVVSFIGLAVLAVLLALITFAVTRSITVTSVVAALLIVPLSLCYILFGAHFRGILPVLLEQISPFYHFEAISQYGILELPSLILLLCYPAFFVFLTVRSADKKRWA